MGKIIGIDYGAKRIGLAIADTITRIAMPWHVLVGQNDPVKDAETVLLKLQSEGERVEAFVVGLPVNMDDTEGPQAKLTRTFGEILATTSGLTVHYQDERLSSFAAEKMFHSPLKSRLRGRPEKAHKPRRPLDAVAAAVILEAFLQRTGKEMTE